MVQNSLVSDYYKVGGSLNVNAPSYVKRQADEKLYKELKMGKFCYVLNCRQMGKSSLRVQVMQKLEKEGVNCVSIDFSKMGSENLSPDRWYRGIIHELWRGFSLLEKVDLKKWLRDLEFLSPLKQLSQFIEDVILATFPGKKIIIFIDEIDSVRSLEFSVDDFFALIRACYNQRVDNQEYERLGFAIFGVLKPSDLIRDTNRTPFNIGSDIELTGFTFEEIKPLESGLKEKVKHPQNVLKEILKWTGGQPFLTQKICQLVAKLELYIHEGKEIQTIEMLVKTKVIENWGSQDRPEHLKTIQNRLLPNSRDKHRRSAWQRQQEEQRITELLQIYRQILEQGKVAADDSWEQMDLQLSGLVFKDLGKLKVYNPIYREVFDHRWVNQALKSLCPFSQNVVAWEDSNFKDDSRLLRGKALQEAEVWAANKTLSDLDCQFLDASDKRERKRKRLMFGGFVVVIAIISGMTWQISRIQQEKVIQQKVIWEAQRFSRGERTLFPGMANINRDRGIEEFKKGNYSLAQTFFKKAMNAAPNNPEVRIYYNNALARQRPNFLTAAAVVPAHNNEGSAKEMLRGVAQAQDEFNQAVSNTGGRLLEIVIANDGNQPEVSTRVARELAKDSSVLAVIGHNASGASKAALKEYEKAGLPMISPTSTSIELNSDVFFRTVPSDQATGDKLAKYSKEEGFDKVVIFYNYNSSYSDSLQDTFSREFKYAGGIISRTVDLSDIQLDANNEIETCVENDGVKAIVFFPDASTTSVAIKIAWANSKLPEEERLKLFGGDALYSDQTLRSGQQAIAGLTLAVPWFARSDESGEKNSKQFASKAEEMWKGEISWRTATSYDATWALIEALNQNSSNDISRKSLLEKLLDIQLSLDRTSGDKIFLFSTRGERKVEPVIVKAVSRPGGQGSGFHFERVE